MVGRAKDSMQNPLVQWVVGLVLAAIVAYFTTANALQTGLAQVKATEESHFGEVLRRLDLMQNDIRELRNKQP